MKTRTHTRTSPGRLLQHLVLSSLLAAGQAVPAQSPAAGQAAPDPAAGAPAAPAYLPPLRGMPATRVGGGTRGIDASLPALHLLVPDHTALSSSPQPSLYWYVSAPVRTRVEFAIINDENFETVAELSLPAPGAAGIQRVSLQEHNVRLAAGQEYRWSVAVVQDPGQRSSDIVASGTIRYQPPDTVLSARIQDTRGLAAAAAYAERGYWYDAVDTVSILIGQQPDHPQLIAWRALLLEQADLGGIAQQVGRQTDTVSP